MEDLEEKDIQDAEIEETGEKKDKKRNYRTEIILIFVIGLLLGIMLKAESLKKVSIGFSDYKVMGGSQEYNLDEIEKRLTDESKKQQEESVQVEGDGNAEVK